MPVITRNQSKKLTSINTIRDYDVSVVKQSGQKTVPVEYQLSDNESQFVSDIKRLLNKCDLATGKTAKIQVSLQIYNRVNDKLEKLLQTEHHKWIKFAATVYNKTSEFEAQRETFKEVGSRLVETFTKTYRKSRKFLANYFKNLRATRPGLINLTEFPYAEMYKDIDLCDFKANQCSRPRRNIPVVDYTGMDMTEDDEETVSVCQVKWTNRVPTYKWVKYPASQANELGDEDWCEEY
jgi:hypothetical protein